MANISLFSPYYFSYYKNGIENVGMTERTSTDFENFGQQGRAFNADDLERVAQEKATALLKRKYWDKVQADQIESQSLANYIVDWYIHSGSIGICTMQTMVGAAPDGNVGPKTLTAINRQNPAEFIQKARTIRLTMYESQLKVNPDAKKQVEEWIRLLDTLQVGKLICNGGWEIAFDDKGTLMVEEVSKPVDKPQSETPETTPENTPENTPAPSKTRKILVRTASGKIVMKTITVPDVPTENTDSSNNETDINTTAQTSVKDEKSNDGTEKETCKQATTTIDVYLPFFLSYAGGHVAGVSNFDITLKMLQDANLDMNGDGVIDDEDLKALDQENVKEILKKYYWDNLRCSDLQSQSIANMLTDWAWGSGVGNVIQTVQKMLGLEPDGVMGQTTVDAINAQERETFFKMLQDSRIDSYNKLIQSNPLMAPYVQQWITRAGGIGLGSLDIKGGESVSFNEYPQKEEENNNDNDIKQPEEQEQKPEEQQQDQQQEQQPEEQPQTEEQQQQQQQQADNGNADGEVHDSGEGDSFLNSMNELNDLANLF